MKKITNMLKMALCFTLMASLAGCGTLLYPERRGQRAGRLDIGVVLLDGLGLLLFIIPGVIAFAVDFSNGTIYLPSGLRSSVDRNEITVAKFDPKHSTTATIEAIIRKETGHRVKLNQEDIEVAHLASLEEMRKRFAEVASREKNIRLALNTE